MKNINSYMFSCVPTNLIDVMWFKIEPHLQRVVDASAGEITLESEKNKALRGDCVFVLVCKGHDVIALNSIEVCTYGSGLKALLVPVVGGNEAFEWGPDFLHWCNEVAKDLGCTEIRGFSTRESWKRVLRDYGWAESHFVIKKMVD